MCKKLTDGLSYFLIHPGGPYWARKDVGAWSIPKGGIEPGEDLLAAALREFHEETGIVPQGPFLPLSWLRTKGGKTLYAWAFLGEWNAASGIVSNQVQIEYPYRSNRFISIPEADRAAWCSLSEAQIRMNPSQLPLLERAAKIIGCTV